MSGAHRSFALGFSATEDERIRVEVLDQSNTLIGEHEGETLADALAPVADSIISAAAIFGLRHEQFEGPEGYQLTIADVGDDGFATLLRRGETVIYHLAKPTAEESVSAMVGGLAGLIEWHEMTDGRPVPWV